MKVCRVCGCEDIKPLTTRAKIFKSVTVTFLNLRQSGFISWLTPLPLTPPMTCGSDSTVSCSGIGAGIALEIDLGVSRRRSSLAPAWRRRFRARARLPSPSSFLTPVEANDSFRRQFTPSCNFDKVV